VTKAQLKAKVSQSAAQPKVASKATSPPRATNNNENQTKTIPTAPTTTAQQITKALHKKGIVSATDEATTKAQKTDEFIVPPALSKYLGDDVKRIPFYRPTQGHQLTPQDTYAVRLNETYQDVGAALEWERIHVRAAMLRAEKMYFYKCSAKNPILVLHGFAAFNLRDGNDRVTDSAKKRCITVTPFTNIIKVKSSIATQTRKLYRATGTVEMLQRLAASPLYKQEMHMTTKDSHIEGFAVAHLYLTDVELTAVRDLALLEDISNIHNSANEKRQVTIRKNGATLELVQIALRLQATGVTACLRTHGTVRVTFPREVNARTLQELRVKNPTVRFFTDTPVSVWGTNRVETPIEKPPVPTGKKLMKISADYLPHPDHFKTVATHFKGTVHQIRPSKYTDRPMSCLIVIESSVSTSDWEASAHQFGPEGLWYISAVGSADV